MYIYIQDRCNAAGIRYLPVVYTSQGGIDPDAAQALRILHKQVAEFQGSTYRSVKDRFDIEMELILLRGAFRADRRRQLPRSTPLGMVQCMSSSDAAMMLQHESEAARP